MMWCWDPPIPNKSKRIVQFLDKLHDQCMDAWVNIIMELPDPPPNMMWRPKVTHKESDGKYVIITTAELVGIPGTVENPFPPQDKETSDA